MEGQYELPFKFLALNLCDFFNLVAKMDFLKRVNMNYYLKSGVSSYKIKRVR